MNRYVCLVGAVLAISVVGCQPDTEAPDGKVREVKALTLSPPERSTIKFVCTAPEHSPVYRLAERVYGQIFQSMGTPFEMYYGTGARAEEELAKGYADGDCGRLSTFQTLSGLPGIVRVGVPIAVSTINLYSQHPFRSGEPLVGQVAFSRGAYSKLLSGEDFSALEMLPVNGDDMALKLLLAGRVSYLVGDDIIIEPLMRELGVEHLYSLYLLKIEYWPYMNSNVYERVGERFTQELRQTLEAMGGAISRNSPSLNL